MRNVAAHSRTAEGTTEKMYVNSLSNSTILNDPEPAALQSGIGIFNRLLFCSMRLSDCQKEHGVSCRKDWKAATGLWQENIPTQ